MSRPQITVTVSEAVARPGADSSTGTAFLVYAGATGNITTPVVCSSVADAAATSAPAPIAAWVGDCLNEGAPAVVLLRAAAVDASAVTQTEWATALAKLTADLGPGQVCIPGVATAAAYAALLAHGDATGRTVLLDAVSVPTASALATTAAGLAASAGATRAAFITPWVTVPASGGTTRDVPGSLIAAGLAARGDARVGHANQAPAGLHDGGAGVSARGTAVTKVFLDSEVDALYDAGVDTIRMVLGRPTLMGWDALTTDAVFHQLNAGRTAMQLVDGITAVCSQFEFRQIDGRGHLYAELEGALRGYLQPLWQADALYGATATDAFDVEVASVNNPTTAAAGELHASVAAALTQHAEKVIIDVVISTASAGAAA